MDEFKVVFKDKVDGKFKENKPLVVTPRSDKKGGKFDDTTFSWEMNIFPRYFILVGHSFRHSLKVTQIHRFVCFTFEVEPSPIRPTQPKR